jgi:hypothetical protein
MSAPPQRLEPVNELRVTVISHQPLPALSNAVCSSSAKPGNESSTTRPPDTGTRRCTRILHVFRELLRGQSCCTTNLYKPLQVRVRGWRPSKLVAIGINDALRFTDQDYLLLAAFKPPQVLRRADLDAPKPVAGQWPFVVVPSTQASRRLGGVAFTILRGRLASKSTAIALLGLNRATRALADVVRPHQLARVRC